MQNQRKVLSTFLPISPKEERGKETHQQKQKLKQEQKEKLLRTEYQMKGRNFRERLRGALPEK